MEISNFQVGQNIANIENSAIEPRHSSAERTREQGLQPSPGAPQIDSEFPKENSRQNVQVNADNADNLNSDEERRQVEVAVEEVETFLQAQNRNLAFSVDEETNRSVVTVKDADSGDVIRQIPSDEVLRLAERIKDLQEDIGSSVGVLYNSRA